MYKSNSTLDHISFYYKPNFVIIFMTKNSCSITIVKTRRINTSITILEMLIIYIIAIIDII